MTSENNILQQPLSLPCGVVLKNRIAKAAMSDSLGNGEGNPTDTQMRLYERWAEGGVALSLIGEVQGDSRYPEKPGNLVLGPDSDQNALRLLANRGSAHSTHLWPQLGHAGALSHQPVSHPKGPSALDIDGLQCEGMSLEEIRILPSMYASAALVAKQTAFNGVQLHAGHGFLLSQFLSPLFNHRTDGYGGSIEGRARLVCETIDAIRNVVGPAFPVGIKINSTDKLKGGLSNDDALELVRMLDRTSVDLIDISGGTYFPGAKASSEGSSSDDPYFIDFSRRAKGVTKVPIMLTGGFKQRTQAVSAIADGSADIVGVARATALNPALAEAWLSDSGGDSVFPVFDSSPSGGVTAWYTMRLTALGEDQEREFDLDLQSAVQVYEKRDAQRSVLWNRKYRQR